MMHCSRCGFDNPGMANFCMDCGAPAPGPSGGAESWWDGEAERRQLTVMFCDLVGSTALAERLDPEDYRELLRTYHGICAKVIARFQGHIHQYLGDGVLAYFGYPRAHEEAVSGAVQAGLAIVEALRHRRLSDLSHTPRLSVRVGIHTGLVVVGQAAAGATLAIGETPNIAARIQALAAPDTVLVSGDTRHLIGGRFDCRDLGSFAVKGLSRPLPVHQVRRENGARQRFDATAEAALSPLVGREAALEELLEHWRQADGGQGRTVYLQGEAGIGKSRLLTALKAQVAHHPGAWLVECYNPSGFGQRPLQPVADLLRHRVLACADDDEPTCLLKLETWLLQYGVDPAEAMPLLAPLLDLPLAPQWRDSVPEAGRLPRTLDLLLHILSLRARRQPVLVAVEDLQRADPATRTLVARLAEGVAQQRVLLVVTGRPDPGRPDPGRPDPGRPDPTPPHPDPSRFHALPLPPLNGAQTRRLIHLLAWGRTLADTTVDLLVDKSDGIPLFVEELTRAALETQGWRTPGWHAPGRPLDEDREAAVQVPASLQDLLTMRFDLSPSAKRVAQLAATLGRTFSYADLKTVFSVPAPTLDEGLRQLVQAGVLRQQDDRWEPRFSFRHQLVQAQAYRSLLRSVRHRCRRHIHRMREDDGHETGRVAPSLAAAC